MDNNSYNVSNYELSDTNNSQGSILEPLDNTLPHGILNNTNLSEGEYNLTKDNKSLYNYFSEIIDGKNYIINSIKKTNDNYLKIINDLNNIISNVNKTVDLTVYDVTSTKEENFKMRMKISDLTNINYNLDGDIQFYKNQHERLYEQLNDARKSYRILNLVFTSKIYEMINIKSKHLEQLLEIKKKHQSMLINLSERIDDLQHKLKDKKNEVCMSCRICHNNIIDISITPCNHLIMCKDCLEELENIDNAEMLCPLCQEKITDFTKIYLPE